MKSLEQFKDKTLIEENEKSDYSKFDMLVRAGLANKAQLQRIHRILDKMQDDRPQFNNADKMILQNLFNKMVDLISNNKQIFQKARQVVKEELDEGVIDTSDIKLSPSGKKVRAHRIVMSSNAPDVSDENEKLKEEIIQEGTFDPPAVLVLKRKAIRLYPNDTRVALYYNDRLDKFFSIPYSTEKGVDSPIQAEEIELEESVMNHIHKIAAGEHPTNKVKFASGETRKIDRYTASAISQVHKAVNDDNKKKLSDMVHKSPAHLMKVAEFAFSRAK